MGNRGEEGKDEKEVGEEEEIMYGEATYDSKPETSRRARKRRNLKRVEASE